MTPDFNGVTETLQTYLDGLYHSDTTRLRRALHVDARYVSATGDDLVSLSMADYLPIVDARPSPASRNDPRSDQITEIQFAGPKTAFVRLNCSVGERYFTDFLTLIRVDNRWQIISKVFHYDIIPA